MGKCTSVVPQSHSLLLSLQHPPSILSVPWPIPTHLITAPGSHFPPLPLDGESEAQVECEMWDLTQARDWLDQRGKSWTGVVSSDVYLRGCAFTDVNDCLAPARHGYLIHDLNG